VLSLMAWALFSIVTLKYVLLIMRADNRGEGGIMALMALVRRSFDGDPRLRWFVLGLGMFGAALFYGDGMITPAISVLSAVEGLEVITPVLKPYVIPITLLVITALFVVQQTGTGRVGAFFGPVMCVWFTVLALLGLISIWEYPGVLEALNPWWGELLHPQWRARLPGAGRGGAGGDRGRGAIRGYGALRQAPDPLGLAVVRIPRAVAELFRAGRAAAA